MAPEGRDHGPVPIHAMKPKLPYMFVRYYLELPVASDDVEEALLASPADWVPGLAG
jgi:hypothetical protein